MNEQETNQLVNDIIQSGYVTIYWPDGDYEVKLITDNMITLIKNYINKLDNDFEPATKKDYEKYQLKKALS